MSFINIRIPYNDLESISLYSHLDCGFEIVINLEDVDNFDIDYFNQFKLNNFTIHAPFFDISLGSKNSLVADVSVEILCKVFNICNYINPLHVIVHHNYQPYVYAFDETSFISRFHYNFSKILKFKNNNYKILFENVFETNPDIGYNLITSFDKRDDLGLCFDIGHFNLFSTIELCDWISAWKDCIYEFHLHNNFGKYDDHNLLTQGTADIKLLISLMCPNILTIENLNIIDSIESFYLLNQLINN